MNITIIGTGKMARGIALRLLDGGHNVTLVGHALAKRKPWMRNLGARGKMAAFRSPCPTRCLVMW